MLTADRKKAATCAAAFVPNWRKLTDRVLPIAIAVMRVTPMIVIMAMVAIAVMAAVIAIRVIAAAIISTAICTPNMPTVDASNAPWS